MILLDSAYWEIQSSAEKGRGIFATKSIPAGTIIGDYIGKIVDPSEDEGKDEVYCMWYGDKALISPIDKNAIAIHLMNYSCMPNCGLYPLKDHMLFVSIRTIFPGEELTVNYYLLPESPKDTVDMCYCETPFCHGAMYVSRSKYDAFEDVEKKMRGSVYNNRPVPIGQTMEPFSEYPAFVDDLPIHDLYGSMTQKPALYDDETLPDISTIRSYIRTTGKQITFSALGITILGVIDSHYIVDSP